MPDVLIPEQRHRTLCDPESGWEDALEAAETETLYESEGPSFCKIYPASRSE